MLPSGPITVRGFACRKVICGEILPPGFPVRPALGDKRQLGTGLSLFCFNRRRTILFGTNSSNVDNI
ncbi:hypothetical protein ACS0PU_009133 [Formica fusca]